MPSDAPKRDKDALLSYLKELVEAAKTPTQALHKDWDDFRAILNNKHTDGIAFESAEQQTDFVPVNLTWAHQESRIATMRDATPSWFVSSAAPAHEQHAQDLTAA